MAVGRSECSTGTWLTAGRLLSCIRSTWPARTCLPLAEASCGCGRGWGRRGLTRLVGVGGDESVGVGGVEASENRVVCVSCSGLSTAEHRGFALAFGGVRWLSSGSGSWPRGGRTGFGSFWECEGLWRDGSALVDHASIGKEHRARGRRWRLLGVLHRDRGQRAAAWLVAVRCRCHRCWRLGSGSVGLASAILRSVRRGTAGLDNGVQLVLRLSAAQQLCMHSGG